ncbi:hypothetical protein HW130_01850 [Streptomyces sp. PKU-EA00015]|uniref:hypothetical protein n=1 Tax=Streptomyces sp. PKU-EA00015 TaxID=2748326 RepID=UPI0015A0688E|nr:hypothetical protein [Streptomyces sp. PKU-EA00015]NWF25014.1 hypothetical protein [Streptomyces sp. PKU-EA00015]
MGEQVQLVAVAGAAAAALVGEMVKDSWSSMRAAAARVFRRGGEVEEQRQLNRLDADQAQIDILDPDELRDRWQRRLITLVEDFPEAAEDLAVLASRHRDEQNGSVNQQATGNSGSVIQVGRDNFGGLNTGGH